MQDVLTFQNVSREINESPEKKKAITGLLAHSARNVEVNIDECAKTIFEVELSGEQVQTSGFFRKRSPIVFNLSLNKARLEFLIIVCRVFRPNTWNAPTFIQSK